MTKAIWAATRKLGKGPEGATLTAPNKQDVQPRLD